MLFRADGAHRTYASRYVQGLLNDSARKSMQPMHGRLSDPGSYQGLQHFITHASWEVRPCWQQLLRFAAGASRPFGDRRHGPAEARDGLGRRAAANSAQSLGD